MKKFDIEIAKKALETALDKAENVTEFEVSYEVDDQLNVGVYVDTEMGGEPAVMAESNMTNYINAVLNGLDMDASYDLADLDCDICDNELYIYGTIEIFANA